jgi:tRNA threonylcarbamoyladenosine biosynthesis protein TsaB
MRQTSSADRGAPLILAFDTAGSACSVAVGDGDAILACERQEMRYGHAEALLPMIDRVIAAAGAAPAGLTAVAVSTGPGGFTGIRAGIAAAQGVALAARAPLIGISSFAAVAITIETGDTVSLVALDSRREDFYVQFFGPGGEPRGAPAAILPERLSTYVADAIGETPLRIAGDAAAEAAAALSGRARIAVLPSTAPDARGVLAAAARSLDGALGVARPLYLRPPDVTVAKSRRPVGARA